MPRMRKNVHKLAPGDKTLDWYARAIREMKSRPPSDPLSWSFQASVHATAQVPNPQPSLWDQCQHASEFFLPWHRQYLLRFERIVAKLVQNLGGPDDWALPYWDYSDPAHRALPPAFRSPSDPQGNANHLFVAQRVQGANAGTTILSARDVDLTGCLKAAGTNARGGFFGAPGVNHFGPWFGALELTPHNAVHVAVGRGGGFMLDPNRAPLDPIFWLHHANIDRLWEVWLKRDPAHQNLTSRYWLSGVAFDFHDETGAIVSMTTDDVLDLLDPAVDYEYEDTSDPLAPAVPAVAVVQPALPGGGPVRSPDDGELAGATLSPVTLGSSVEHIDVPTPVHPPTATATVGPAGQPPGVTLVLEHVRSSAMGPTYDVFVAVPASDDPAEREDRFVGRAALFGVAQASDPAGPHGGGGQTIAFDISELYGRLANDGELDPSSLRVSFVPVEPEPGATVTIGRISIYVE